MSFSDFNRSTDVVLSSGYYVAGKSGGSGSWRGVLGNNGLSGKVYFEISVTTYDGLLWLVGPKDGGESHVKFWNFQQWMYQDTPKGKHVNIHAPLIT